MSLIKNIMPPISSSRTPDMTDSCKQMAMKSMNSPSLKRKRPPKIEIPMILREIVIDTMPKSRECQDSGAGAGDGAVCFSGFGVGVVSVKGKKSFMEDTHKIVSSSHVNKGFFGVYDGHGGSKAAEFVAENLHSNIFEMLENCSGNTTKEEAIKAGFLKTDDDFLKQGVGSGACCVTAMIEGNELVVSNIGDCRAVLCKGGKAEPLTIDHRAANEDERMRIEKKGGYVVNHRGAWRVHGILAVSRSIGDAHLKDWVVAEPETKVIQLTKDMDYVVLASDGLWEEVGNQEATDIVMRSCAAEKRIGLKEDENVRLMSSSPKLRRFLHVKSKTQNKSENKSPCGNKSLLNQEIEKDYGSENESPATKTRRISMVNQIKIRGQNPDQENKGENKSPCGNKSPLNHEIEKDFGSENESPATKTRRISKVNQIKIRGQNPDQENSAGCKKRTAGSDKLMDACNELVNLAVNKGSLDDITVMIIDLKQFKK